MNTQRAFNSTSFVAAALALVVLGQACGKDDKQDNPPVLGSGGSSAGAAGKGGALGSGGTSSTAGSGGTDVVAKGGGTAAGGAPDSEGGASPGSGGAGPDTGGQPAEAGAPSGTCFERPKTSADNLQFLNRCTDSRCSSFDNSQRIPGFTGILPPL
ncbi:MAG: hypothetical protein ACOY0T_30320 [Myxococcota bacterium]